MRLAYLRMISSEDSFSRNELAEMARSMGMTFEYPDFGSLYDVETVKRGWAKCDQLLEEADAFVLDGLPLYHDSDLAERFHRRVASGARAIVFPYPGNLEGLQWWQRFLGRYGIGPSWVKLVGPEGERLGLEFRRDENCFRDPELFVGVKTVIADSPFAIWYEGEAWPVLVSSPGHWGVDASSDLPDNWNGREMACVAVWHGATGSAVLVSSAFGILSDPFTLPLAGQRPGIDSNRILARNILRFLQRSRHDEPLKPEDRCKRVETNLVDFVLGVLKPSDPDWWVNCVPEPIRKEAAVRQEEERNRIPSKEAYLDFIHLKKIIEKKENWKLFEPHFRAVGLSGGKDSSLSFFDSINELRRLVGHPLKMHVSGYSFSPEDKDLLIRVDDLALKLAERVRQPLN